MMDRRQFLKTGLGLAGSLALPAGLVQAAPSELVREIDFNLRQGERRFSLVRAETQERLDLVYMVDGRWVRGAYPQICHLMRDVQAGQTVNMDLRLLGVLDWLQSYLRHQGYGDPIYVTSGYRSRRTNARIEGAAKDSEHTRGRALDLHVPGIKAGYMAAKLKQLQQGGVGTYSARHFVHLDTGAVRSWQG